MEVCTLLRQVPPVTRGSASRGQSRGSGASAPQCSPELPRVLYTLRVSSSRLTFPPFPPHPRSRLWKVQQCPRHAFPDADVLPGGPAVLTRSPLQ